MVINARAEGALDKPMFRKSLLERRCVAPATGFFEWNAQKQKHIFRLPDSPVLYLGGFWNTFQGEERFVILTTAPNETIVNVHDRMPVVLREDEVEPWLRDAQTAVDRMNARQPDLLGTAVES
ncbi:SOS response-associated peptidase [Pseudoflavonifractor phocaeensis]|nr:SOS response-associated peptidase [Pseudoflavonifractor phocaeensis]